MMNDEFFRVGNDLIARGRWMQVATVWTGDGEESCEPGATGENCFAVDQDGESHELTLGCVDHFYTREVECG